MSKELKNHMKQARKEYKAKYGKTSKLSGEKKLPKAERRSLEIYAIKSHYGNYEVRERNALTGKAHGPKWDEVFKTKKEAEFRNKRANELAT